MSAGVFSVDVVTGAVIEYGLADGLPTLELLDIAAHPDGTLWVATAAGVSRIVRESYAPAVDDLVMPECRRDMIEVQPLVDEAGRTGMIVGGCGLVS